MQLFFNVQNGPCHTRFWTLLGPIEVLPFLLLSAFFSPLFPLFLALFSHCLMLSSFVPHLLGEIRLSQHCISEVHTWYDVTFSIGEFVLEKDKCFDLQQITD